MPQKNITATVLRCYDLGEKDQILVLLTAESGKLRVVAKGAKRPGGRFAAAASPFTEISASIHLGQNLHTLSQVQITSSHRQLRERLDQMAVALFMTELVDHATVDGPGQSEFLMLLSLGLLYLENGTRPELLLSLWLMQLLDLAGLNPSLQECANCQADSRKLVALSARAGGLVCADCAGFGAVGLSPEALRLLWQLTDLTFADLPALPAQPLSVQLALCRALEQFVFYQLEVRPRSYDFLASLRPEIS